MVSPHETKFEGSSACARPTTFACYTLLNACGGAMECADVAEGTRGECSCFIYSKHHLRRYAGHARQTKSCATQALRTLRLTFGSSGVFRSHHTDLSIFQLSEQWQTQASPFTMQECTDILGIVDDRLKLLSSDDDQASCRETSSLSDLRGQSSNAQAMQAPSDLSIPST